MEHHFGRGRPYSLGVEEEFQLVSRESFELVSRVDEILSEVEDEEEHEGRVKHELLQSVVEVATHVAGSVGEAMEDLRGLRARLRDAAEARDSLIASSGTHPFSRYEHQEVTDRPRYQELAEDIRWVAERELIFGLHVHVGLDSPETAIACTNGVRTFLPEFLALSANSPFWQARPTGLASTRVKIFDMFPRSGLPPSFSSWEEFEHMVDRAMATNAFEDATYIWWDARPHPKLGTIEIRMPDAQTRLESVRGLVALSQSLVATLAERHAAGEPPPTQPFTLVDENKWRAARDGLDATLIDLEHDTERPAREALRALVERCEPAARKLGCADDLATVEDVLRRGNGADEQRRIYEGTDSLLAVAQWIAEETVRGL
ncbi:MAG TPA: glutamate--cysteine ligase [Gaiellaceae bacterium]|nr:glutamate--cysteine ligase [Gaiellaceae bacterium]